MIDLELCDRQEKKMFESEVLGPLNKDKHSGSREVFDRDGKKWIFTWKDRKLVELQSEEENWYRVYGWECGMSEANRDEENRRFRSEGTSDESSGDPGHVSFLLRFQRYTDPMNSGDSEISDDRTEGSVLRTGRDFDSIEGLFIFFIHREPDIGKTFLSADIAENLHIGDDFTENDRLYKYGVSWAMD